jgi:hypothetical protein
VLGRRRPRGRRLPVESLRLDGPDRWQMMTLYPHEFIRRFLQHVLPTLG